MDDQDTPGTRSFNERYEAKGKYWLLYLAILCALIFMGVMAVGVRNISVARNVGAFFLPSLVIAFGALTVFRRVGKKGAFLSIFVAVWASFVLGSVVYNKQAKDARRDTVDMFIEQAAELQDSQFGVNPDGTLQQLDHVFEPSSHATGTVAEAQKFMSDLMNDSVGLANEYRQALNEIGWMDILDPARLQADENLVESRAILEKATAAVAKYAAANLQLLKTSPERIDGLNMTQRQKADFKRGYASGLNEVMSHTSEVWRIEGETVEEFGNTIEFLANTEGSWRYEGDRFTFASDRQAEEFDEILSRIDDLMAEQIRIQDDYLEQQGLKQSGP